MQYKKKQQDFSRCRNECFSGFNFCSVIEPNNCPPVIVYRDALHQNAEGNGIELPGMLRQTAKLPDEAVRALAAVVLFHDLHLERRVPVLQLLIPCAQRSHLLLVLRLIQCDAGIPQDRQCQLIECGWDVSLKVNHDGDMIAMFEELGISWSLNEIDYFTENYDDLYGWENGTWETKEYTFDSGLRQTFTHSVELLEKYKTFLQDRENRNAEDDTAAAAKVSVFYEESTVGSKGYHVQILQQALIEQGYISDKADGIFGPKTASAVKNAQADLGLEQTGIADVTFLKALYAIL